MLERELDALLDYEKQKKSDNANARNGYPKKKISNSLGETEIVVPRNRASRFNPMLEKKREGTLDGLENIIISLYAKGYH